MERVRSDNGILESRYTNLVSNFNSYTRNCFLKWNLLVLFLCLQYCREVAMDDILEFNMTRNCGEEINLMFTGSHTGRLEFSPGVSGQPISCTVAIVPGNIRKNIGFTFEDISLPPGVCLRIRQRYFRYGDEYNIIGLLPMYCGPHVPVVSEEYRTKSTQDLVLSISGKLHQRASFKMKFILFNENEIKAKCTDYECQDTWCAPGNMSCNFGYSPCDFYSCGDPASNSDTSQDEDGLSNIQIYGIVFGFLLGFALCLCRVSIKSGDIKEEIINRVASFNRNGQNSRHEVFDLNRLDSVILEDTNRIRRFSREGSFDLDIQRSPSLQSLEQNCNDLHADTPPSPRRTSYSPPSFTTVVQCNYSDLGHSAQSLTNDPGSLSEHETNPPEAVPLSSSHEDIQLNHNSRSSISSIESNSQRDTFPSNAMQDEYSDSNTQLLRDHVDNYPIDHSSPPYTSINSHNAIETAAHTNRDIFSDNEYLNHAQPDNLRDTNVHRNINCNIDAVSEQDGRLVCRTDNDISPTYPPPSYADFLQNEDRYSIKPV